MCDNSSHIICGLGFNAGTCVKIDSQQGERGVNNGENENIMKWKCECNNTDLFNHDLAFLRQRDCSMSIVYMEVVCIINLILSVISLVLTCRELLRRYKINSLRNFVTQQRERDTAFQPRDSDESKSSMNRLFKYMLFSNFFYGISTLALSISSFQHKYVVHTHGTIALFFVFFFGFMSGYLMLYSISYPLFFILSMFHDNVKTTKNSFKMRKTTATTTTKNSDTSFDLQDDTYRSYGWIMRYHFLFWIVYYAVFRIVEITLFSIIAINYDDPTNERNDEYWSMMISLIIGINGFEGTSIIIFSIIIGFKMIHIVEQVMLQAPNGTKYVRTLNYIKKIRSLMRSIFFITPSMAIGAFAIFITYFSWKYVPFSYMMYSLMMVASPVLQIAFTLYSKNEQFSQDEENDQNQQPQKQQPNGNRVTIEQQDTATPEARATNDQYGFDDLSLPSYFDNEGSIQFTQMNQARMKPRSELTTVNSVVTIDKTYAPQLLATSDQWKSGGKWEKYSDGEVTYYVNLETKETTWENPYQ